MKELGIDYVRADIEKSRVARVRYDEVTKGESGVPVIVVGTEIIRGYSDGELQQALSKLP